MDAGGRRAGAVIGAARRLVGIESSTPAVRTDPLANQVSGIVSCHAGRLEKQARRQDAAGHPPARHVTACRDGFDSDSLSRHVQD